MCMILEGNGIQHEHQFCSSQIPIPLAAYPSWQDCLQIYLTQTTSSMEGAFKLLWSKLFLFRITHLIVNLEGEKK